MLVLKLFLRSRLFPELYEESSTESLQKGKILPPFTDLEQFGSLSSTSTSHYVAYLVNFTSKIPQKSNACISLVYV